MIKMPLSSKFLNVIFLAVIIGITGCEQPYIYPSKPAAAQPVLEIGSARMADGFRLPLTRWPTVGEPQAIVLALHGLNDYRVAFNTTGNYLAEQGISVYAYDQRGFGETEGAGYWHGSAALISDLKTMTDLLRQAYPGRQVYIMGESMGGAVTLAAQSGFDLDTDGLILVAPAIWSRDSMPWYQRLLLWSAVRTLPGKRLTGEGLEIKPTDNMEMLYSWARDPLVIKATRVDVLYGVTNLMDRAVMASKRLQSNALLLYGKHDAVIPRQPTCQLVATLNDQPVYRAKTVIYDKGHHMLTRDLHANLVLQDIADWILSQQQIIQVTDHGYCAGIHNQSES
ncbi:MAG: alpha/beta hydrolase [Nitrosomonas sp.]|jgi:alpha-beta hydrolase superfamily lysophospholipase|nr:MAG: alpha/beta hydrolase [Nitrosomonas sp.]